MELKMGTMTKLEELTKRQKHYYFYIRRSLSQWVNFFLIFHVRTRYITPPTNFEFLISFISDFFQVHPISKHLSLSYLISLFFKKTRYAETARPEKFLVTLAGLQVA